MRMKYGIDALLKRAEMKGTGKAVKAIAFGAVVIVIVYLVMDYYIF